MAPFLFEGRFSTRWGVRVIESEVLVIGSEGAGARAAIAAADAGSAVTVVTKGRIARSGATLTGAADLDVDSATLHRLLGRGDPGDSSETFFRDIVVEGKYLNPCLHSRGKHRSPSMGLSSS